MSANVPQIQNSQNSTAMWPKLKNKTYVKCNCGEAKEFYDHKRILKTKFDSYDWLLIFLADKKTHKFLLLLLTLE